MHTVKMVLPICLFVMLFCEVTSQRNSSVAKKLFHDLLSDYDNDVRPTEPSENITRVQFEVYLKSVQDLNEIKQTFTVSAAFALYWNDSGMVWDPKDYNGIWHIEVSFDRVWTPNFVLVTPTREALSFGKSWQKIRYTFDGYAIWFTAGLIQSTCDVNSRNYPFDSHFCTAEFIIWGYTIDEIDFILESEEVDLWYYKRSGTWDLLDTSVTVTVLDYLEWPQVAVTLHLKRRAGFVMTNVLGPVFILNVLNLMVFLLVPESGERISFCLTVLLSISVFLTIVNENLPKSSEPMPLISYKLMVDLASSAFITVAVILNMKVYHMDADKKIPRWMKTAYLGFTNKSYVRNKVAVRTLSRKTPSVTSVQGITDVLSRNGSIKLTSELDLDLDKLPDDGHNRERKWIEDKNTNVSWRDIGRMVDYVFMTVFSLVFLTSSIVYMILVRSE